MILADRPAPRTAAADPHVDRYRRTLFACAGGLCLLLCIAFGWSWEGNRSLLRETESAATFGGGKGNNLAALADLQALEALRSQLQRLRDGAGWSLHWGLYSGDRILEPVRAAYFNRFQRLLLNHLNGRMVAALTALPAVPTEGDRSGLVYRALKTHLMITGGSCSPDPAYIAASLKKESRNDGIEGGPKWHELADRQIEFYASEFAHGNPCRLHEDAAACGRAREYLQASGGVEEAYRAILSKLEQAAKPLRLSDSASNYAQVLSGQGEARGIFTPAGWKLLEKESKERNTPEVDSCVVGHRAVLEGDAQAIQRLFIREYVDNWKKYLAGFSVLKYNDAQDAARKLDILTDHRSPLLGLFALVSNQTWVESSAVPPVAMIEKVPYLGKYVKSGQDAARKAAADLKANTQGALTTNDIAKSFQPVQAVVPPGSESWVVAEKNGAYVDALSTLRRSMQDIAADKTSDAAIYQAAGQNYEKALDAVRQIAKGFKPIGVDGLDRVVQRLLEEPIQNARKLVVVEDPDKSAAKKINADLQALCRSLAPMRGKYPFKVDSANDTALAELTGAFAPGTGSVWKFQAQSLGELIVKDGSLWKVKDPAKKLQVTPEMLAFLDRVQSLADVFFASGTGNPQMNYALRPVSDSNPKDWIVDLVADGQHYQSTTGVRRAFTWPAAPGAKVEAVGRIHAASSPGSFPFASRDGAWGIFKIIGDAEPRQPMSRILEWKYSRGGDGRREPMEPSVRIEIAEFPGNVDVFHPSFFAGLGCPATAVR